MRAYMIAEPKLIRKKVYKQMKLTIEILTIKTQNIEQFTHLYPVSPTNITAKSMINGFNRPIFRG